MIILSSRLLKKSSNRNSRLVQNGPINIGLYVAFKHHISFATVLAANFGCNQFIIMPAIVSKLVHTSI